MAVPKYFPKMKPATKDMGDPKPKSKIQMTTKTKKERVKKIKLSFLNAMRFLVLSLIYEYSVNLDKSTKLKTKYNTTLRQII